MIQPFNLRAILVFLALSWMGTKNLHCACAESNPPRTIGRVERLEPALDRLVPPNAKMDVIDEGFAWCEGPVWVSSGKFLLFSDIPNNAVMRWDDKSGVKLYLKPAGYTGDSPRGGESGSNGLTLD